MHGPANMLLMLAVSVALQLMLATVALTLGRLPVRLTTGPDRRHPASVPASFACGKLEWLMHAAQFCM